MTTAKENPVEKYIIPVAFLLGAVVIAVAVAFGGGGATPKASTGVVDIKNVSTDNSPYVGSIAAPVTIAVWFDYQCPYCKRFELDTLEKVYTDYVKEGKVRIVYKDFQFLGPDSTDAGLFARAVWDAHPDKFHDWYMAVMTAQDEEHAGFGNLASVAELSRTVDGIDVDRVLKLVSENKTTYQKAMDADRAEAQSFGIKGTPGAIIGTTVIGGAQPYLSTGRPGEQSVKDLIEAELNK